VRLLRTVSTALQFRTLWPRKFCGGLRRDISPVAWLVLWGGGTGVPGRIFRIATHARIHELKKNNLFVGFSSIWLKKKKLRGLSPRANYTDRAAAAGRRNFLDRGEVGLLHSFDCDFNSGLKSLTHVSSIATVRYRNARTSALNLCFSNAAISRRFCFCSAVKQ